MKRILVVDDDPEVRRLLTEVLLDHYAVTTVDNGAEALDSMGGNPPDAVVLDMLMPVMDGWTFLAMRRQTPRCARVPVMVVSAEPSACEDGRRLGAQACLPKPFDLDTLSTTVDQLVLGTYPRKGSDLSLSDAAKPWRTAIG